MSHIKRLINTTRHPIVEDGIGCFALALILMVLLSV